MASTDKVKVAVRVRPFNRREVELLTKCIVDMDDSQTVLYHPSTGVKESGDGTLVVKKSAKPFAFDYCFWSIEENNPKFASQQNVFNCLGKDVLERAFEGYNACIFAYGQTGSGKSYTMMGTMEQKGIIPRLCDSLFEQIAHNEDMETSFKVQVSYMEIYNEKVRDLLDPKGKHNLRVREHNILGPYVDDLLTLAVSAFEDIDNLMSEGNKSRTVAATNMNSESSRSHAVFSIILTQTLTDPQSGVSGEKVSKMSLVDLAGSERAQKTGAVGDRLKEGSNINKSLTTLGLVISALADSTGKTKNKFVPYRDSVLTWLLKDNLGGNSKTVMVATVSPSADNYEETLSTLRYADRAKRIVNHAVVNEDPNARIIRELREEVEMLKKMLDEAQNMKSDNLRERLSESEKLMNEMGKTWEQKLYETEAKHQERHAALEKMGISVQMSGIKVEQGKYYLINLNADPLLNELLVYYLKDHTLVGRADAPVEQDIQLSGLGIEPEHCIVNVVNCEVFLTPLDGARTCVNGCTITSRTQLKHGDRILWGNNHFFRCNCPKSANSPSTETPDNVDYEFAQQELMIQQMGGNDPIQEAISAIEKQHDQDKQDALDKQRQMYERQMQMLRNQLMSPSTPSQPYPTFFDPFAKMTPTGTTPTMHPKYQQWAQEREKLFKQSLAKLKEEVVKANALVRDANFLAQEMGKEAEFSVTLQIPAENLSPNRKRGAFVSEPAILVKRKAKASQIWSVEKSKNKIIDMREMYEERKEKGMPLMDTGPPQRGDPFYESQENHNLIGVANVFLEALFSDVKLDYQVPIISQQGEVAGRLHIELCRMAGALPDRDDLSSEGSGDSRRNSFIEMDEETGVAIGTTLVCKVCIKEARGLPPVLSNFVFCQYAFWGHHEPIVVPPVVDQETTQTVKHEGVTFIFDHAKEFTVQVNEEFMEHCTEGALSIEVWGHRCPGFTSIPGWELEQVQAKSRSIMDRWTELTRKIELWTEIHELSDQGEYTPVEVVLKPEVLTGGVFQLRQGHSRRILVQVKTVQNSGTLPIICECITHVSIGCVCARSKLQKGLDSYHEEDLTALKEKWTDALDKRRKYLDEQLQKIMNKEGKSETDADREKSLIDQWVCLTEERNAVLVPAAGSGIPGAPADWTPPPGMEQHVPVIFLDLNADDMSTPNVKEGLQAAGVNSILPKEHGAKFYTLPFVKNSEKDVCAILSWDSSIHDSVHLNRVTPNNERVYLILKAVVRLSHPASMELILRKRICINVYKRQSITDKLKKRIGKADTLCASAVAYEIVSNIPKASEDLEDRESLAQIAASQNEQNASDGETYIEKYIRGVTAVESILTLDRLRQEVAIKELMAAKGRPLRKATSVPNIHNILASPRGLDEKMRSDSSQDLSYRRESDTFASVSCKQLALDTLRLRGSPGAESPTKDNGALPSKPPAPFGLASPVKPGVSPQPAAKKPLTTLVEEQNSRECKPLLQRTDTEDSDEDEFAKLKEEQRLDNIQEQREGEQLKVQLPDHHSEDSDDFQEFQEFQDTSKEGKDGMIAPGSDQVTSDPVPQEACTTSQVSVKLASEACSQTAEGMTHSATTDSLVEDAPIKNFTPSIASSGYGSQAVSSQTLSSEDSSSIKSISTDDTPDLDHKKATEHTHHKSGSSFEKTDSEHSEESGVTNKDDLLEDFLKRDEDEEKMNAPSSSSTSTCSSLAATLKHSESLIDSDVPSNLGSPIQPTPTTEIVDRIGEVESVDELQSACVHVVSVDVEQAVAVTGGSVDESQSACVHDVSVDVEQAVAVTGGNAESADEDDQPPSSALSDSQSKHRAAQPDAYSEQAMQQLEKLEVDGTDEVGKQVSESDSSSSPLAPSTGENAHESDTCEGHDEEAPYNMPTARDEVTNSTLQGHPNHNSQASVNQDHKANQSDKVKLRSKKMNGSAEDKVVRRRSWADRSEHRAPDTIHEDRASSRTASPSDIKIKKPLPETSKTASLKPKGRGTDKQGAAKGGPSPMKATYRPVAISGGELVDELEADSREQDNEADSDNEDKMSICSFGSRADLHRLGESPVPTWIQVTEPVLVLFSQGASKPGTVQFVGTTEFATGNWIGVELDSPDGKNDGSVKGVRYFKCRNRHGVFVRHDKVIMDKKRRSSSSKKGQVSSSLRRSTGSLSSPSPHKENGAGPASSPPSSSPSPSPSASSFMKPTAASSAKRGK